jgi:hypothetical protein
LPVTLLDSNAIMLFIGLGVIRRKMDFGGGPRRESLRRCCFNLGIQFCEPCEGQARVALFILFNQRDMLACRDCVSVPEIDTFGAGFHSCHLV